MTEKEIERGENEFTEFKRDFPSKDSKLIKTVVAFANGKGGKIIFGVDDETHEITGIENNEVFKFMDSLADMISDKISPQINPHITFETLGSKTIVIAEILQGQNPPYFLKAEGSLSGVYVRVAATTRKAEREKIKELVLLGEGKSYDKTFENHEPAHKNSIYKLCNDIEKLSHKSVKTENLIGWGLLRQNGEDFFPSVAYRLLAENDFHFARIQCGVFKGKDKVFFVDRKEYEGPIYEQIENAYNFVIQHLNLGAKIEGLYREDVPEIPPAAIRELIVNAVMHRNYLYHSNIQVCIYDDRLEIINPGGLYGGLTIEKMLSGISSIRNELIADVFLKMGIVEKWGTGIKRVAELCKKQGLKDVKYTSDDDFFTATIYRKNETETSPEFHQNFTKNADASPELHQTAANGLSENEQKTLEILVKNPYITAEKIAAALGVSSRSVKNYFATLKKYGLIEYAGSKKDGHWIIKDI